jgi:NADPH2:quinone reductase
MMKGLDVLGCPTVISTVQDPSIRAPRLAKVLAWASAGDIKPLVAKTFSLADFLPALRAKWQGEYVGGIVLHPAP